MNYLITGGAGFIGSHLAEKLREGNHRVLILDDLSTGRYENIEPIDDSQDCRLIVANVTNRRIVEECVKEADIVFHLASAVGVRKIIQEPVRTIESIVRGTDTVLEACACYRRPVLLTSTSEVYGRKTDIPFSEDDDCVMGATSKRRWSYACSKALDEFLALAYWYESRLPVYIVRLFNTVGPRQTGQYGMVVPTFVRQALRGEPITVYGDGEQSRCFGHVKDVVEGLAKIVHCSNARGQVVNLGTNEEVTILQLANRVKHLTGSDAEIRFVPYEEAYGAGFDDMRRRVPALTKAHDLIGYKPSHDLDSILSDVIAYERARETLASTV